METSELQSTGGDIVAREHLKELRAIRKSLRSIEAMLHVLTERSEEQADSFARTDTPPEPEADSERQGLPLYKP